MPSECVGQRFEQSSELLRTLASRLGGQSRPDPVAVRGKCREGLEELTEPRAVRLIRQRADAVDHHVGAQLGGESHGGLSGQHASFQVQGVIVAVARGKSGGRHAEIQVAELLKKLPQTGLRHLRAGSSVRISISTPVGTQARGSLQRGLSAAARRLRVWMPILTFVTVVRGIEQVSR